MALYDLLFIIYSASLSAASIILLFMWKPEALVDQKDVDLSTQINADRIKNGHRPLPTDIYGRITEDILKKYRR